MSKPCQIIKICKQCSGDFSVNCARKDSAFYCSRHCYRLSKKDKPSPVLGKRWILSPEIRARRKGKYTAEKNGHWKGGIRRRNGYIFIYKPNHPFVIQGCVPEHRLVMEQILGRYLKSDERVHHLNKIRNDNRPENLILTNLRDHPKLHPEIANHIKGVNRWK